MSRGTDDRDLDVRAIDWSSLRHAYGPATDLPLRWDAFLANGDPDGELLNTVCHQGSVCSATAPLLPFLIRAAKSGEPHVREGALGILGAILSSRGGFLFQQLLLSRIRVRSPFAGGMLPTLPPPDPAALQAELDDLRCMQHRIELELDDWLAAARSDEVRVRGARCSCSPR